MAGNDTHHYDVVMEFAENALSKMLEPLFGGEGGLLGQLVNQIPGLTLVDDVFTIDVFFDRPSNVGLPAGAPNPLDIRINLALGGLSGQIRLVVGLVVDRSKPDEDAIQLDFPNLYWLEATVVAPPLPPATNRLPAVEAWLRAQPPLRLPGFKVDRATTDPAQLKQLDVTVIDDVSGSDSDAMAFCLTFGGGGGEGLDKFKKSFIPGGETGAAAIFFGWMLRMVSPKIAEALGVNPSAFTDGHLNESIDVGDGAQLTKLVLEAADGFIRVEAQVKKSGPCYDAKGTVTAKIKIAVESGKLVVQSEIGDPDIDVDIPWYCYLAAALIGVALGGILGGVIASIVGAVVGPIVLYIVHEVIEGIIDKIVDAVASKINSGLPNFEVPAYGLEFVFQEVRIDDIMLIFRPEVRDNAPIRCSGVAVLYAGQGIDLDNGIVGDRNRPGVDLAWTHEEIGWVLKTVCIAELGRTGSTSFDGQTRFSLYRPAYSQQVAIPASELEWVFSDWWTPYGVEIPTFLVYGVLTNERRLAAVQVLQVENDFIILRFRTYDTSSPTVQILGGFPVSLSILEPPSPPSISYQPSKPPRLHEERVSVLAEALGNRAANLFMPEGLPMSHAAYVRHEALKGAIASRLSDIIQPTGGPATPRSKTVHDALQLVAPSACRVGVWTGLFHRKVDTAGTFVASCNRIKYPATYYWYVNGKHLDKDLGQVSVGQQTFDYDVSGANLTLKATRAQRTTFELKVKAVGADGIDAQTTRCVTYEPEVTITDRTTPSYTDYRRAYQVNFGSVTSTETCAVQVVHG